MAKRIDIGHGLSFRLNEWMVRFPLPKQAVALALCELGKDVLYGGAAGGGKTDTLLMAALQYVDLPDYKAAIIRRTYKQLKGADGIIRRSQAWGLEKMGGRWNDNDNMWSFPSGAVLKFSYLDHPKHQDNFQGHEFQFIGRDEVTQWADPDLCRYPDTRLRRSRAQERAGVPLRIFNTSNPGGVGHLWVKRRWVDGHGEDCVYIPTGALDNPYIDAETYLADLKRQSELVYQRLGLGNWQAEQGEIFRREWFKVINAREVPPGVRWVHSVDPASSAKTRADNFASGFVGVDRQGDIYIEDIQAWQSEWPESKRRLVERIRKRPVEVVIEGISGFQIAAQDLQSVPELVHVTIRVLKSKADKVSMAQPWAARAEGGKVFVVDGPGADAFIDECLSFPSGRRDDRVDVVNNGVHHLGLGTGGNRLALPKPPPKRKRVF